MWRLNGAVNDVSAFEAFFRREEYLLAAAIEVSSLINEEATQKNIQEMLSAVVRKA